MHLSNRLTNKKWTDIRLSIFTYAWHFGQK
jgi:hypothetical protein